MQVTPFIYFYGQCEEALIFYKSVFGGDYDVLMRNTNAPAEHVTPEFRDKISAARFTAGDLTFMASDGAGPQTVDAETGNISLALTIADAEDGQRVFAALLAGGHVKVPYEAVPWGGRLGVLHDRFGTEWIVTGA